MYYTGDNFVDAATKYLQDFPWRKLKLEDLKIIGMFLPSKFADNFA